MTPLVATARTRGVGGVAEGSTSGQVVSKAWQVSHMSNEKNPGSVWAQAFVWQLLSLGGGPWCELCHGITY